MHSRDMLDTSYESETVGVWLQTDDEESFVADEMRGRPHFHIEFYGSPSPGESFAQIYPNEALELVLAIVARLDPMRCAPELQDAFGRIHAWSRLNEKRQERVRKGEIEAPDNEPTINEEPTQRIVARTQRLAWDVIEYANQVSADFQVHTYADPGEPSEQIDNVVIAVANPKYARQVYNVVRPVAQAHAAWVASAQGGEHG